MSPDRCLVIEVPALGDLVRLLRSHGFEVVGPTLRDGAVVLDVVEDFDHAVVGRESRSGPGSYHTEEAPGSVLGGPVGPTSPKRWMSPPNRIAWSGTSPEDITVPSPPGPRAYLGIRPCDAAAMEIFGKMWPGHPDDLVIVAECTVAGDTCFCVSMGTGPSAGENGDIALTELGDGRLLVRACSDRGSVLLAKVDGRKATAADVALGSERVEACAESMGRTLDADAARTALKAAVDSSHWESLASRCMACTNCTMVCPTCFCVTISDTSDLSGVVSRTVAWDSCFTPGFSEIHGGPHRVTVESRYRQWITHKLSTWWDQFGNAGCVGCGRCITWCPVGIDITAEAARVIEEVQHV